MILTLSDGQATVEQCFSINNNFLTENMKTETVIARKFVIDHMLSKT